MEAQLERHDAHSARTSCCRFFSEIQIQAQKELHVPSLNVDPCSSTVVENCKPPTSSMHKYLVNWMVWRRQQCTSLKWGMPGRHVLSERCRNYLNLYTEGCSWGRLQLPESLVIFTKQHRWFLLSDKADAVQYFPSVVTQSLVTNYCIGIVDSVQHLRDVAGADALATFLNIPVFRPLQGMTVVFEIPAHRFYLCVDLDESSFGCQWTP